jgi:hypothetical protein
MSKKAYRISHVVYFTWAKHTLNVIALPRQLVNKERSKYLHPFQFSSRSISLAVDHIDLGESPWSLLGVCYRQVARVA